MSVVTKLSTSGKLIFREPPQSFCSATASTKTKSKFLNNFDSMKIFFKTTLEVILDVICAKNSYFGRDFDHFGVENDVWSI